MVPFVEGEVGTFRHGQTLLLSESGIRTKLDPATRLDMGVSTSSTSSTFRFRASVPEDNGGCNLLNEAIS